MNGARILLVEDQALNRELLHAHLEGSGYVLLDAVTGEEALEVAARERPDLVLLDVMLPGIDGYETARLLKEAREDFLPIILLTALTDHASRLRGLEVGADEYLTKPVEGQELKVRIRNLLALRGKEALLARRNVALAELNRFKDEMSALLVHDLKNPVTVILGNLSFVEEEVGASADLSVREALEDARAATQQVLRLIANLLDLTRMEAHRLDIHRSALPVAELFHTIVNARRHAARSRNIAIEVTVSPDLTIDVDADLITRVGQNLVDNAFRYTGERGRIHLAGRVAGDHVRLEIANTGPAIPVEARITIFEKFGQTNQRVGRMNLGLGLYFCRMAVEAHGGRIWVEETPSYPTKFVIELPR